ncbi:MAG: hypothetical protein K6E33_05325, partial [Lachnospiraceae bacterium]|nr:hypothetical protein [Lachnospiraceae bacterium]
MKKSILKVLAMMTAVSVLTGAELPALAADSTENIALESVAAEDIAEGSAAAQIADTESLSAKDEADESAVSEESVVSALDETAAEETEKYNDIEYETVSGTEKASDETVIENTGNAEDILLPEGEEENGKIDFDGSDDYFEVTLEYEEVYYDGNPKKPGATVKYRKDPESADWITLSEGTDYTIEYIKNDYSNNTDPGYAEVEFSCPGNDIFNKGSFSKYFLIRYKISAEQIEVKPVSNYFTVSNNDLNGMTLYFSACVPGEEPSDYIEGTEVKAEETGNLTYYYNKYGQSRVLSPNTTYSIYASLYSMVALTGEYKDEDDILLGNYTTNAAGEITGGYADGYEKINFKATILKNQNIKFSWSPKAKDDPSYKDYKKYKLFMLDSEGEFNTQIWPLTKTGTAAEAKGSKSATIKYADATKFEKPIVCLKVYDKNGSEITTAPKYLTSIAPYVFYVRTGNAVNEQTFCYSGLGADVNLTFTLEAAEKNKNEMFTLSSNVPSTGADSVTYPLNKKTVIPAFNSAFSAEDSKGSLTVGTKYFFRAKSVYNYKGMAVTSAPSNVFGVKAGPASCYVYNVSGVNPDTAVHSHYDSFSTCFKNGYVEFVSQDRSDVTDSNKFSRVELLRSDSYYGTYKVVKKYKPTDVKKYTMTSDGGTTYTYYYLQYNKFPPEETWYYAVRAVSKAGSAAGGYDYGCENTTTFEKVREIVSVDTGSFGIGVSWLHDDCAKKYYVYRGTSSQNLLDNMKMENAKGVYKKLSGSAIKKITIENETYKYHLFTDTKVQVGDKYYYAVRPVYNEKVAKAQKYDEFKDYIFETGELEATASGVQIKKVTAAPYSTKQINVKWSAAQAKSGNKVTDYVIERKLTTEGVDGWVPTAKCSTGSKEFKSRSILDIVKTGMTYQYRVKALYNNTESASDWDVLSSKGNPASATATTLKAATLGVTKQTGSSYCVGGVDKSTVDDKEMNLVNRE